MNIEKQIDIVEEALKNRYSEEPELPELSSEWQTTLMARISNECTTEDSEAEIIENEFLYFSWIAAGIAAALIIISSIIYTTPADSLENDIQELYSNTALDNLTTAMVIK